MALIASRKKVIESSDKDSYDGKAFTLHVEEFREFLMLEKMNNVNKLSNFVETSKGDSQWATQGKRNEHSHGLQCIECWGYKQNQTECINYAKANDKVMKMTLSEKSKFDNSCESKDNEKNFMTLISSVKGGGECSVSALPNVVVI